MLKTLWSWIYIMSTIKSKLLIVACKALHVPAFDYYSDLISYHFLPWHLYFSSTGLFFSNISNSSKGFYSFNVQGTLISSITQKVLILASYWLALFHNWGLSCMRLWSPLEKNLLWSQYVMSPFSGTLIISLYIIIFIVLIIIQNDFFFAFFLVYCLFTVLGCKLNDGRKFSIIFTVISLRNSA